MSAGFCSPVDGKKSIPAWADTAFSCSMAAGRYTSQLTVSTFFFCRSLSHLPSLAVVVVLPAPCRPDIRITAGGWVARFSPLLAPPISSVNSRWTTPTRAWPGVREPITSWPSAFSLTLAMKSLTTGRATSASSSAMRTSRSMSPMLSSVRRAWPRRFLTTRPRRWVRLSSMVGLGKATGKESEALV
jgi:hypothetical protein